MDTATTHGVFQEHPPQENGEEEGQGHWEDEKSLDHWVTGKPADRQADQQHHKTMSVVNQNDHSAAADAYPDNPPSRSLYDAYPLQEANVDYPAAYSDSPLAAQTQWTATAGPSTAYSHGPYGAYTYEANNHYNNGWLPSMQSPGQFADGRPCALSQSRTPRSAYPLPVYPHSPQAARSIAFASRPSDQEHDRAGVRVPTGSPEASTALSSDERGDEQMDKLAERLEFAPFADQGRHFVDMHYIQPELYSSQAISPRAPASELVYSIYHSREFWVGRVLKIFWSEPKGANTSAFSHSPRPSDVFSKNRRFIVMESWDGHSVCVPIMTYGNQGCNKAGTHPECHGIVYTGDRPPRPLPGEGMLGFSPIRMIPTSGMERLHKSSRVNFRKHYTVEHNFPVLFVGRIAEEDFGVLGGELATNREVTVYGPKQ